MPATNGGTGSSYTSGTITFKNTEGSGKVTHTLKMTNSDNQTKPCNFDVTYKSGSGGTSLSLTNTGNNTGGPLVTGTYSITDIASCSNVRFNCEWNNTNTGCSIKVNSNAASSGGMNSSNNILSPKPQVGDVLTVNGTVTNIWCSTW